MVNRTGLSFAYTMFVYTITVAQEPQHGARAVVLPAKLHSLAGYESGKCHHWDVALGCARCEHDKGQHVCRDTETNVNLQLVCSLQANRIMEAPAGSQREYQVLRLGAVIIRDTSLRMGNLTCSSSSAAAMPAGADKQTGGQHTDGAPPHSYPVNLHMAYPQVPYTQNQPLELIGQNTTHPHTWRSKHA
jgi:hypothetical protein